MSDASTDIFTQHLLIILSATLPLASFVISFLISDRYSWTVALIASVILLIATILSGFSLGGIWHEPHLVNIEWFHTGNKKFSADLLITNQSLVMLFTVSVVSFLVHVFSIGYMAGDMNQKKYFGMLGFFTFAMQGIVLADNLLFLFVFWELVGFASYMLIGHYMEISKAGSASKKAFIMNRIGDAGFMIGLMIVWTYSGSFDISQITFSVSDSGWRTAASVMIFFGVIGKSAQFPLFTWLPDAMEGPTPVSALIHAATMVAAGVYLMIRLFPLFDPASLDLVAWTGAVTALTGGLCALSQFDIKRILAYSTISQLGLMIMTIGAGAPEPAFLHLFTHAFFKAGLFLCAGVVIHCMHHAQVRAGAEVDINDIRNMGGLSKKIPVTFFTSLICGGSLTGIPFSSGYLSKEAMLNALWSPSGFQDWFMLLTMITVSILTILYTFRFIWYVFLKQSPVTNKLEIAQSPAVMRLPLIVLAAGSCWFAVSFNPFSAEGWAGNSIQADNPWAIALSLLVITATIPAAWVVFRKRSATSIPFLKEGMYVDKAYLYLSGKTVVPASRISQYIDREIIDKTLHWNAYGNVTIGHVVNWADEKIIDGIVHFFAFMATSAGAFVRSFQGGKIQLYIFWAVFSIIIFLIYALN